MAKESSKQVASIICAAHFEHSIANVFIYQIQSNRNRTILTLLMIYLPKTQLKKLKTSKYRQFLFTGKKKNGKAIIAR